MPTIREVTPSGVFLPEAIHRTSETIQASRIRRLHDVKTNIETWRSLSKANPDDKYLASLVDEIEFEEGDLIYGLVIQNEQDGGPYDTSLFLEEFPGEKRHVASKNIMNVRLITPMTQTPLQFKTRLSKIRIPGVIGNSLEAYDAFRDIDISTFSKKPEGFLKRTFSELRALQQIRRAALDEIDEGIDEELLSLDGVEADLIVDRLLRWHPIREGTPDLYVTEDCLRDPVTDNSTLVYTLFSRGEQYRTFVTQMPFYTRNETAIHRLRLELSERIDLLKVA